MSFLNAINPLYAMSGFAVGFIVGLTGVGGGTWDAELGEEHLSDPVQALIIIDAVGFCRLVANRATLAELEPHITGDRDHADGVLAAAMSLALD